MRGGGGNVGGTSISLSILTAPEGAVQSVLVNDGPAWVRSPFNPHRPRRSGAMERATHRDDG